jgi:hypothetical protein
LQEIRRSGLDISSLVDTQNYNQSPIFSISLIPDDATSVQMGKVLQQNGLDPASVDTLKQTALYYANREGKN